MAPRRSAAGCIRRPQSRRWTRRGGGPHPPRSEPRAGSRGGAKTCRCGTRVEARAVSHSPDSRASATAALWKQRRGRGGRERGRGTRMRGADGAPTPLWSVSVEPRDARPLDAPPDTWLWPSPLFPSRAKLRSCQISRKKLRDASALLAYPPPPPSPWPGRIIQGEGWTGASGTPA